jgi:hypothetical protein
MAIAWVRTWGKLIKGPAIPVSCPYRLLAASGVKPLAASLLMTMATSIVFIMGIMAAPMVMGMAMARI